ncbi:hypothetical protein U1Q18_004321 [Sarracenia purpurea var. burkii]
MRFRDSEAVDRAINMYNGVWCLNKKLIVKHACESNMSSRMWNMRNPLTMAQKKNPTSREQNLYQDHGPNMRRNKPRAPNHGTPIVLEAKEINEEWIKSCAMDIVKEHIEVESIREVMVYYRVHRIKIKTLGENKALINFSDYDKKNACLSTRKD